MADRTDNLALSEMAVKQIAEALETAREGGDAYLAAEFEEHLRQAKSLVERRSET